MVTAASSNGQNYKVVITGSTRGIGRAMAQRFLDDGDSVVITSKTKELVNQTVKELANQYGRDRVSGIPCNVAKPVEVAELAAFAKSQGGVDLWINNAGTNAYQFKALVDVQDQDLIDIVETNVLGVMLCCREAITIMKDQANGGHIFNMEGAGSNGRPTPRFAAYGATKRSLGQLGKSLAAELKLLEINSVGIHVLSPGMVTTELLMSGSDTGAGKFFINCLAEEPQTVAKYLVPKIRKVPQESTTLANGTAQGVKIEFLTAQKAYSRILQRAIFGKHKNRFVPEG